jgi:hypothetical protein
VKRLLGLLVVTVLVGCAGSGGGGDTATAKPSREDVKVTTMRARVVAVDPATRRLTLEDAAGDRITLRADEAVKNLAQVKVGDEVLGEKVEMLAVEVREATPEEIAAPAAVGEGLQTAELGQKPAGRYVRVMREVFSIVGIDKAAGTVTVRSLDDGQTSTVPARDPRNLDLVEVGDTVVLTYTESLTLAVVPPGQ